MKKNFEINRNGQNIRCLLYYNKGEVLEKAVLYGHGFAGHKETAAAEKFAERVLTKYKGICVLVFDLPCHGSDVKKKLTLQDCLLYISLVLDYIKSELHISKIYSYATSFGAYLVLKYILDSGNPFEKIVLRSPAVHMYRIMTEIIMDEAMAEQLKRGKPVQVGFDRKIGISQQFIAELEAADIEKSDFLEFAEDILIIHGTRDELVDFATVEAFADNNIIELVPAENGDHRFHNPALMELAVKKTVEFFGF